MRLSCSSNTSETTAAVTTPPNDSANKDVDVDSRAAMQRFLNLICIK